MDCRELHVLALSAVLSAAAFPQAAEQNLLDQKSSITGKHSALVTFDRRAFRDNRLQNLLDPAFYMGGDYNIMNAAFMFQTCYGGGMIDELRDNFSNISAAFGSASRHDQVAWTLPTGSHWTDTMRPALQENPRYVDAFVEAYQQDPVGPVSGPNPPAIVRGVPVTEEPQWAWSREGNLVRTQEATKFHAILWGGQADLDADRIDVDSMYRRLKAEWMASGKPFTIEVLFGNGVTDKSGAALPAEWNARSATYDSLTSTLAALPGKVDESTQFAFYATGHGTTVTEVIQSSTTVGELPSGGTLNLTSGEFSGMVLDASNLPSLEFLYRIQGSDPIAVFLGGYQVGTLDPGATSKIIEVDENLLLNGAVWSVDRMGLRSTTLGFSISPNSRGFVDYAAFSPGAISAPVPEPASLTALGAGMWLLVRRKRS